MVDKSDISVGFPTSEGLRLVANGPGNVVDADTENYNNEYLLTQLINIANWIIDSGVELNSSNLFTLIQQFQSGIQLDLIKELTTNSDILVQLDGTGKFKYGGTATTNEVANKLYVLNQIAAGVVSPVDFLGATNSTDGVKGLVPTPLAGEQDKVLLADGTWSQQKLEKEDKSTSFNAVAGKIYDLNATATFTATLPASPADRDHVGFINSAGNAGTNNITIDPGTKTIHGDSTLIFNVDYGMIVLRYDLATTNWIKVPYWTI